MKARKLILFCLTSALAAAAQTAPPSQRVAPDTSKTAAKPMAAPAKPQVAVTKAPVAKPAAKSAASKPVKAAVKTSASKPAMSAKRDPFLSPVREGGGPGGPDCNVGKKCLAIDSIQLKGIVRAQTGSIAVVESSTRKTTYFLRENDPVFNGFVVKITPDAVLFRENVMDRVGKQSTRDITKRVSAPPV